MSIDRELRLLAAFAITLIVLVSCKKIGNHDCSSVASTYNANIKPLVSSNCATAGCHTTGSPQGDFTTYNGLKAVADNGKLEKEVIHEKTMPPSSPLSLDDREKIKCWLDSGAPNN